MRVPPLQPPLVWQVCLLFWCAGILTSLWPIEGLCAALLLLLADTRFRMPRRVLLAMAVCMIGVAVGRWQLSPVWSVPSEPAWLAITSDEKTQLQDLRICGVTRHVQGLSDGRLRVILEDVRPVTTDNILLAAAPLSGRCAWTWDAPGFRPLEGQTVCVSRRPVPVRGFANTSKPEQEARWAAQGVFWRIWSRSWARAPSVTGEGSLGARLRERLRRDLLRVLWAPHQPDSSAPPPQAKAILPALLFGDRSFLTHVTLEEFAAASLAHSLALSGQHLAIAGLIGFFSIFLLARLLPGIYLFRACPVWVALASLPPALAYLWLGDAPASLIRATCMLGFMTIWLLRTRTATGLDALLAALGCIILMDPLSLFDLSLQLSVLCVAVICLSLPGLRRLWLQPIMGTIPPACRTSLKNRMAVRGRAILHGLGTIFLLSLCIQLCLLPFMLSHFGSIGLWFPLNVVWLPAVDLMVLPGAALGLGCAALGLDSMARVILDVTILPCDTLLACLDFLHRHGLLDDVALLRPHWTALTAFTALAVSLAVLAGDGRPQAKGTARRWLMAGLLLLCMGPVLRLVGHLDTTPRLEVFDVGQGLAVGLRLPDQNRLLIDGGGMASPRFDSGRALLAPALTDNEAPRLKAVFNSHPDLDHAGGLVYLLHTFQVAHLFHNGRDATGTLRETWRQARQFVADDMLTAGDILRAGDDSSYQLEVLHPPRMPLACPKDEEETKEKWSGNNASLVLRLTRNGQGLALFTGDVEPTVLRRLLARGTELSARILVAPHHGSDRSFLPEFYEAVRPELIVAGCGFRNRWGYPGQSLRAWLASHQIPLLETGNHGKITVTIPQDGPLRVVTAKNGS